MEKYSWLLKQRSKAVGLFGKVIRQLDSVHDQMVEQIDVSEKTIEAHELSIKSAQEGIVSEKSAIEWLAAEQTKTLQTKQKISEIIGSA
jgi:hypothetical protein